MTYIPIHLKRYLDGEIELKKITESTFTPTLREFKIDFEHFYKKLRKIDKATFLKVGHFLHYYAGPTSGKYDHATTQLRFLASISAIKSCYGESKKLGVAYFLKENTPEKYKEKLFRKFDAYDKAYKKLNDKNILWNRLVDIRNNFMHRSILIAFSDDVDFASISNYGKSGKYTGSSLFSLSSESIVECVKAAIINYFWKKTNDRKPLQNFKIYKKRS